MNIDYESLLPLALMAMFPNKSERQRVEEKLDVYGEESFHRELSRVKLGILYLVSQKPDEIDSIIELACADYRDLLCAAEYPYSSRRRGLQEKDPEKYKKLKNKEENEYLKWIEKIIQA